LLSRIKRDLPELEQLLDETNREVYEDGIYRYYHTSFKVYGLKTHTRKIAKALRRLAPDKALRGLCVSPFDAYFASFWNVAGRWMVETGAQFRMALHAGPIVEAFFHARYFLEMVVKYGKQLEAPPQCLPSGWAAVLCLYNLR